MITIFHRFALGSAALAAVAICPAQAACWSPDAVDAARVRDMETMLMVASLRCRLTGVDFMSDYNSFISESRPTLVQVNEQLRAHFGKGPVALNGYDRYVTGIANRYGGGAEGLGCADMKSIISAARAEKGSLSGLVRLASDAGVDPNLPGGRCPVTLAAR